MSNHQEADEMTDKLEVILRGQGSFLIAKHQPSKRSKPLLRIQIDRHKVLALRAMTTRWQYVHQEIRNTRNFAAGELDDHAGLSRFGKAPTGNWSRVFPSTTW